MKKVVDWACRRISGKGVLLALISSLTVLYFYDPQQGVEITRWNRTFCQATLGGIDIGKRISNYYVLVFVLFPICLAAFSVFYSALLSRWPKDLKLNTPKILLGADLKKKFLAFSYALTLLCSTSPLPSLAFDGQTLKIFAVSVVALLVLSLALCWLERRLWRFPDYIVNQVAGMGLFAFFASAISVFSSVMIPFLAQKSDIYAQMQPKVVMDSMTLIFAAGIPVTLVMLRKCGNEKINANMVLILLAVSSVSLSLIAPLKFSLCVLFVGLALALVPTRFLCVTGWKNAAALWLWHGAAFCFLMEILFVVCQKNEMRVYLWTAALIAWILPLLTGAVVLRVKRIGLWISSRRAAFACFGGLLSLGLVGHIGFAYEHIWNFQSYAHIYEMGNKMVAMDSLLKGAIPILDYFSAHALSDVWTILLYGLFDSGIEGALVDPYVGLNFVAGSLLLFVILSRPFGPCFAFLFVAFFPAETLGLKTYSVCQIAVVMQMWLSRENFSRGILFRQFIFWLAVALNAFFIYDEGISLGIGAIVCCILVFICRRQWSQLKSFAVSGIAVGGICLLLVCLYCLFHGISFLDRAREWLSLSIGSNSTWATSEYRNSVRISSIYAYYVLPLIACFILIYSVLSCLKSKSVPFFAAMAIIFSLAELLSMPRGIVWHNLWFCNGTSGKLLNYSHYAWSFFGVFLLSRNKRINADNSFFWMILMACCIWMSNALVTFYLPNTSSALYNQTVSKMETDKMKYSERTEGGRYRYDLVTQQLLGQFTQVFEKLLQKDETFLDFANMAGLYAMTGRERPFYVAQSPSLLTDQYSQKEFLDKIGQSKVPIVLTGLTSSNYIYEIGWVPHNVRYFRIAEFIYVHYRPLVQVGEFAIWCEKSRCDEFEAKLNGNSNILWNEKYFHQDLGKIPYIWANLDNDIAIENTVVAEFGEKFAGSQSVVGNDGNYVLLEIDSDAAGMAAIHFESLGNPESRFSFKFDLNPGRNNYLVRVSMHQNWHLFNIDFADVVCDGCKVGKLRILQGD